MRKSIIFTLGLMLGVFGMTGCSKDATNEHINGDVDVKEFTLISHAAAPDTRMVIEGDKTNGFNTVWEEGDQIGIYATDYVAGEEATNNLLYTCNYYQTATVGSDGKATFTGKIRSTDSNEFNLFAYYPYTSGSTYADTDYQTGVNCAIAATQTMNDKSFDKSCAYMVAKTGLTVKISADSTAYDIGNWQFRHVNAFINLGTKAITADGVSGEEIVKSATIEAVGSSETNPTLAGSFQFNLENGEMTFTDETPQNAVTVNVPDGTTLADLSAWFVTNPFTLTADDKLEIVINTKTHVIKKNVTIAKSFEAANAYTLNLTIDNNCEVSDAPEEDYSGTYLILAKVTAGNYWYLMPKETSNRLDAEDTEISNITNYESSAKDFPAAGKGYAWVIEKTAEGDTYTIKSLSTNMYIYGASSSSNYAKLSSTEKEVVSIVKTDADNGCTYNIKATSVTDKEKYLGRNSTDSNKYFAFYTSSLKDLVLIPYVATPHIVPNKTSVDVEAAGGTFDDITYTLENFETTPDVTVTCGGVVTEAIDVEGTIMYTVSKNTTSSVQNGWIKLSAEGATAAKITVNQESNLIGHPETVTITEITGTTFQAKWTAVTHAATYDWELYQGEDKNGDLVGMGTASTNSIEITSLPHDDISVTEFATGKYVLYVNSATADEGYTISEAEATKSDVYEYSTTVTEKTVTFDLTNISGFSDWSSSYATHTVEYEIANVKFTSANRQTGTITDCPVTKGQPIEVILNSNTSTITAITITLKQWTTKAQTATLHYSTDGGANYTSTTTTSSTFVLSSTSLPAGTNAIKVTFSSSNQVGCQTIEMTYTE